MVEKLKDVLISFPRWCVFSFVVGYDREVVAAKADDQVAREAIIDVPASIGKALCYLFYNFLVHALDLSLSPGIKVAPHTLCRVYGYNERHLAPYFQPFLLCVGSFSENTLLLGRYKRKRGSEVTGYRGDCKERSSAAVRDEKEKSPPGAVLWRHTAGGFPRISLLEAVRKVSLAPN